MSRKIVHLEASNIMRLKAVSIDPGSNVVIVGGENAQGKTSVLDSISMAIGGKRLCPPEPIRTGEDHAEITLQLGDLLITRTFDRTAVDGHYKSALAVRNAAGEPLKSPQSLLDALVKPLAFDPLEFATMNKRDSAATLRELVGLDVEQLEEELERVYAKRTEKGQDHRRAKAVADDMPWYSDVGTEIVSIVDIGARLSAAGRAESERQTLLGTAAKYELLEDAINERVKKIKDLIEDAKMDLLRAENDRKGARAKRSLAEADARGFVAPDIDAIQAELDGVEAANRKVRENQQRLEKTAFAEEEAEAWKVLETKHHQITETIRKQTEAVEYPIEGLELRQGGVYYQDVPFEQGSRAERIKVSLAMGMAMNDEMKVLLIRDGSVLDDESMKIIAALAETHDFQFWIEMARGYEKAEGAILIEDGEVASK